jgi:uncharacterized 2Fe-2S/4Fe-4S cluster protein (DUF4445 family)
VIFQPSGRRASAVEGDDLLTVARRAGVDIESACGGKGSCGKCRVRLETPSTGSIPPVTEAERRLLGPGLLDSGLRLACQVRPLGDVRVFVPEESRRAATTGTKEARERVRELDPAVKVYTLASPGPATGRPPDEAALLAALEGQHGLVGLEIEPEALSALSSFADASSGAPPKARAGAATTSGEGLAAAVWQDGATASSGGSTPLGARVPGTVLSAWPATHPRRLLGLALDIGTTTIAGYLADLSTGEILGSGSALNPQIAFGDDIISRMQYAAHHPEGAAELQRVVIDEVNKLTSRIAKRTRTKTGDIMDAVMVGNTTMHHLFLGIDTDSLRKAPFEPAVQEATNRKASTLGLSFHPACRLYALPNEAGFVGADNVAVIIAEEPYRQDEVILLIDVGTNGELVLGDRRRMLSASCATGPAFEGAHIEHGMRAAPGAIERIRIDPETLGVSFKVIGNDAWNTDLPAGQVKARGICGSGIIEAAAEMFKAGVILPDGGFDPHLSHQRILLEDGRPRKLIIAREDESVTGRAITVSLKDIRAMQLGKAALRAGAEILLDLYGVDKPERVVLAGAFGSYIDKHAALAIGMFPACDPEKVSSVGNAAGDGALMALLAVSKRREAEWAAAAVEYVELAAVPDFQEHYIQAMRFEAPDIGQ